MNQQPHATLALPSSSRACFAHARYSSRKKSQILLPRSHHPRPKNTTLDPFQRSPERTHHTLQPDLIHLVEKHPHCLLCLRTRGVIRYPSSTASAATDIAESAPPACAGGGGGGEGGSGVEGRARERVGVCAVGGIRSGRLWGRDGVGVWGVGEVEEEEARGGGGQVGGDVGVCDVVDAFEIPDYLLYVSTISYRLYTHSCMFLLGYDEGRI